MTLSDALSLVGIAISVVFGILGIYLAVRRAKYPASITFVREQSVALLADFARKVPNLAVLYRDTPIEKSVVLLSGYVVNDGALDITKEMTEESLTCVLPVGCMWLEFKVTTSAPALHVNSSLVDNERVRLDCGLFRRDESFSFQALVLLGEAHATNKIADFADQIKWKHRIASLGAVKTVQMPPQPKRSKRSTWSRRVVAVVASVFYALIGLSVLSGLGPLGRQVSIVHVMEKDGKKATVKLIPAEQGKTTMKDVDTGETTDVELPQFVKSTTFVPTVSEKREVTGASIFFGVVSLFASLTFLFIGFSAEYRRYKLQKLVASSAT